ncbi:hypothetical protein ACFWUT_23620 [Streptomyces cyaneofuscatus]
MQGFLNDLLINVAATGIIGIAGVCLRRLKIAWQANRAQRREANSGD